MVIAKKGGNVMSIEDQIKKYLKQKKEETNESEDGVMAYLTAHPHGGRGRQGHNKGMKCPHCGKNIDLRR